MLNGHVNKKLLILLLVTVLVLSGLLVSYKSGHLSAWEKTILGKSVKAEPKDPYFEFLGEVYDKIKENYWSKIEDEKLVNVYRLATERVIGRPQQVNPPNREGIKNMWKALSATASGELKKDYAANIANLVLGNLEPFGRSGLYTRKDEQALKNTVQNINPQKDLYKDLGLPKEASSDAVNRAYKELAAQLSKESSPTAKERLKEISYAHQVLTNQTNKQIYDKTGGEPTVFTGVLNPYVAYLKIKQMSPATLQEFVDQANSIKDTDTLDSLILDLRGNIGGSIDILPYFLGPFIGPGRYAYEFFHQGNLEPNKTVTDWLPSLNKYKKVVILIDGKTQSTAEVMASTLKKYNVGILVGVKTHGWGTVERVFNLANQISTDEKYSMFLVHSLTVRDDGNAIEGSGVEPVINTSNPNWEKELNKYFNSPTLINTVKDVLKKAP
jgi:C-terminal processing protease CtpA/Prc